jgi:hypothetical protein
MENTLPFRLSQISHTTNPGSSPTQCQPLFQMLKIKYCQLLLQKYDSLHIASRPYYTGKDSLTVDCAIEVVLEICKIAEHKTTQQQKKSEKKSATAWDG